MLHELRRGTVIRKTTPHDSTEVGIVLGPSAIAGYVCEVAHGWIDSPPTCGLFDLSYEHARRGIWQIATEQDAVKVRAMFLAHGHRWGADSVAWVALGESDWSSPRVALRIGDTAA